MSLEHLFDAELKYQPGMSPIASDGEGRLIGSGEGVVRVEWLDGTLRWTLFERPGELVCATHGGTAPARAAGGSPPHCSSRTHDVRYSWLNGRLAVWEGEFDAKEERARYHAYLAPELRVR